MFDSREKACMASEIMREVRKADKGEGSSATVVDTNITLARKAAVTYRVKGNA